MHWTSQDEKGMIKKWAGECSSDELTKQYFSMPASSVESYWCKHDETGEIGDYDFDTIPELKTMLEQEMTEEFYKELLLPLAVAAFKEKEIIQNDAEAKEADDGVSEVSIPEKDAFSIPEFVYVF